MDKDMAYMVAGMLGLTALFGILSLDISSILKVGLGALTLVSGALAIFKKF